MHLKAGPSFYRHRVLDWKSQKTSKLICSRLHDQLRTVTLYFLRSTLGQFYSPKSCARGRNSAAHPPHRAGPPAAFHYEILPHQERAPRLNAKSAAEVLTFLPGTEELRMQQMPNFCAVGDLIGLSALIGQYVE